MTRKMSTENLRRAFSLLQNYFYYKTGTLYISHYLHLPDSSWHLTFSSRNKLTWLWYSSAAWSLRLDGHWVCIREFPVIHRVTNVRNLKQELLTCFKFITTWMSNHIHYKVWNEITYPFINFNGVTVEVYEWISNFISHFTGQVITYPCWDYSQSKLAKWAP